MIINKTKKISISEKEDKRLIVFGTLFKSKMGAIKDILVLLGKEKEVKEIDAEYEKRKLLSPWGLKELAKLYFGFSKNELKKISFEYCQKNLLPGLKELVIELKKKGFLIGVLSSNPEFILDCLKLILPLDFVFGTQLDFQNGIATGEIKEEFTRYKKAEVLKRIIKKYGIKKENVIFVGKSTITQLPIAKEAGIAICFDPEKESFEDIAEIILNK